MKEKDQQINDLLRHIELLKKGTTPDCCSPNGQTFSIIEKYAGLGHWELDPDTGSLCWSEGNYQLFGLQPQEYLPELTQESISKFVQDEDVEDVLSAFQSVMDGGHTSVMFTTVPVSGRPKRIRACAQFLESENKIMGINLDITALMEDIEAISVSHEGFRRYFEMAPLGIFIIDNTGHYLDVNPEGCRITGYSRSELTSMAVMDLIPRDSQQMARDHFQRLLDTGFSSGDLRFASKNGTEGWWQVDATRLTEGRCLGFVTEITQRKAMEIALIESEEKFRNITRAAKDGIVMVDSSGKVTLWNHAATEIFGYEEQEMIGRNLHKFLTPDRYLGDHRNAFPGFSRTGQGRVIGRTIEIPGMHKDGYEVPVELSLSAIKIKNEWHGLGIVRDIRERLESQRILEEREELLRNIVERSSNLFYAHTVDREITYMSPKTQEFFDCDQQYAKEHWHSFFTENPVNRKAIARTLMAIETGEEQAPFEVELKGKTGRSIWVEVHEAPVVKDGKTVSIVGALVDITDRKRNQEALEKRILALTRPLSDNVEMDFEVLFDINEIQKIQDLFAESANVASVITKPDGTPITRPSRYCRLCRDIIRKNPDGRFKCTKSDQQMGRFNPDGPTIGLCSSGGLWTAAAGISVGGRHIATWLIGQVRNESQTEGMMRVYARELGEDEEMVVEAFREVPLMALDRFKQIAWTVYTLADQLSRMAYQNIQQAWFISEKKESEKALMESEERFRLISENTRDGIIVFDKEQAIYSSPAYWNLLGYSKDDYRDFSSDDVWNRIHPDDLHGLRELLSSAISQHRKSLTYSYRAKKKSGEYIWREDSASFIYDDDGNHIKSYIVARDITERRENEFLLEMAIDASQAGIWEMKLPSGEIQLKRWDMWERISGYNQQDYPTFYLEMLFPLLHPDDAPRVKTELENAVASNADLYDAEYRIRHKDGYYIWVNAKGHITRTDDPENPIIVYRSHVDITDRKLAEEKLRESEERFRKLSNLTLEGIIIHCNGVSIDVNQSFADMVEYSVNELIGINIVEKTVHPDSLETIYGKIRDGSSEPYRAEIVCKNGRVFPAEIQAKDVIYNGEKFRVAAVRDISDRVRAEREKKNLESQLRQAQKLETIGTLAGGIAHDFNNLLTPIIGYSELLIAAIENPLRKANVESILKSAVNARDLVKQLLAFSRQIEDVREPIDLGELLKDSLVLLRASIPVTIEIALEISEDSAVLGDRSQINQIIMNLGTNAFQAMGNEGRLSIGLDRFFDGRINQDFARIVFRDTGQGMTREVMDRVFEPFFTTRAVGDGSGLGLSVVHGIVKSHNGNISIASTPGEGSKVTVLLPVFKPMESTVKEQTELIKGNGERVLLVDDSEENTVILKRMLTSLDYKVETSNSSLAALELFKEDPEAFDVVVSDLTMPRLTGIGLSKGIHVVRKDIPFLIITGYAQSLLPEKMVEFDVTDVIMKPVDLINLGQKMRHVLTGK